MNKKVVILHNEVTGQSNPDELDVLNQAGLVSDAYKDLGYNPVLMQLGQNLYEDIVKVKEAKPLFVFNLVEAVFGKGELLYMGPALLHAMHIPYTGVPHDALFLTTSKVLAKKIMVQNKIPTPGCFRVLETGKLIKGRQYIVKPVWEDGSVGLDEDSVFTAGDKIKTDKIKLLRDSQYFIEEYIEGREFNISILGGKNKTDVLQPAEMIFRNFPDGKPKMLGYKAKWDENSIEYRNTVRSFKTLHGSSKLYASLKNICLNCWQHFHLKGYARVDFRLDKNEQPYVIEINGNPCIAPDSGFIAAARHAGYDNKTIISRISEELN
ncbi:MAG: ATP-grasp domain-containing protein [Bacteroidales bacterium]|nr:ATP-grasp domain-containing protein [Bacteroidales bacterium]